MKLDLNDIVGKKLGIWNVLSYSHKIYDNTRRMYIYYYNCVKDNEEEIFKIKRLNLTKYNNKKIPECRSRLYNIWVNMKGRCYNKNIDSYKNYGGRGISVCNEWKNNFKKFKEWSLNNGYKDDLTIDRIDVNGNYEPSNCRWVDMKTQGNNTRRNHLITFDGKTKTMTEWAEEIEISYTTLRKRLRDGWSIEDALTKNIKTYSELPKCICKNTSNKTFLITKYGNLEISILSKIFKIDKGTIKRYLEYYKDKNGDECLNYYLKKKNIKIEDFFDEYNKIKYL